MSEQFPVPRAERAVPGSCQRPAHATVRAQIPWQPIRSSSRLPAGALDRRPDTGANKHSFSTKKVDVGGMKPGITSPGRGRLMDAEGVAAAGRTRASPGGTAVQAPRDRGNPSRQRWGEALRPNGGSRKDLPLLSSCLSLGTAHIPASIRAAAGGESWG